MNSQLQLEADGSARSLGRDAEASGAFSALVQAATVEFLSSVQLLAERARFLTGAQAVAIALKRNGKFVYCASAGGSAEPTKPPETHHAPIANCLATAKPATVSAHTSRGQLTKAAIPVVRQQEVVGFFEISVARAGFSSEEILAVSGLAEMVNTALDLLLAAESAHQQILQASQPSKPETTAPLSWHAEPQSDTSPKAQAVASPVLTPLNVHSCQACGFPVSDGRKLCVECDQKPGGGHQPQLLAVEKEESWISANGYTIASLLVTALLIALIYWLR